MTQLTKERNDASALKIRAALTGNYAGDARQLVRDVAESFASDIEGTLRVKVPELADSSIRDLLRHVLEERFATILASGDADESEARSSLPVVNLKPSEVIEQRKVRMSLASLYRYVEANKFYCVVPSGQSNGREFPAWQFAGPVPELLPPVLLALRGALRTEVHAFLVTAQDALNELAPAELLAGAPFETRASLHPSQQRLLQLPANERLRKVLALINGPGASMAA
ncbi:hypothetical protein CUJ91_32005 (plasmid) [Paraburkholderia graminis]|uniref:hypothetical protein n=1 Tax=Paraburkholderia graminis TaxID=60548 RepID=UPI000DF01060|nr:hypothetical protein [Paraburkholderia graminis]AXF12627.1 hypothetical protein CUJ91_32005 [Paraburkholderia graminis]